MRRENNIQVKRLARISGGHDGLGESSRVLLVGVGHGACDMHKADGTLGLLPGKQGDFQETVVKSGPEDVAEGRLELGPFLWGTVRSEDGRVYADILSVGR